MLASDKLRQFLEDNGITQRDFGDEIGRSQAYISFLVNGERMPSMKIANAIAVRTNNRVPVSDWLSNRGE